MTNEEREDLNTFRHDLVKQARWWQWKAETLEKENEQLKAENAALCERLGKAIILSCKLGDKLYFVNKYLATPKIQEHYITAIEIFPSYVKLYVEDGGYFILNGDNVYFNPEAAEARLKELKGEKE